MRYFIAILILLLVLPALALADEFSAPAAPPIQEAPQTQPSEGPKLTERTDSGLQTTQEEIAKKTYAINNWSLVDPGSIDTIAKYKALNQYNVFVYSVRRSKVKGGHAWDLQTDLCWKGSFTDKVKFLNGKPVVDPKDGCGNDTVAFMVDYPQKIECSSTFITQVQTICEKYIEERGYQVPVYQVQEQLPPPKRHMFRRPGTGQAATVSYNSRHDEGIIRIVLGAVWSIGGGTRINNSQTANGGAGGNGAAAAAASSSAAAASTTATPTSAAGSHGETSGSSGSASDGGG